MVPGQLVSCFVQVRKCRDSNNTKTWPGIVQSSFRYQKADMRPPDLDSGLCKEDDWRDREPGLIFSVAKVSVCDMHVRGCDFP